MTEQGFLGVFPKTSKPMSAVWLMALYDGVAAPFQGNGGMLDLFIRRVFIFQNPIPPLERDEMIV